MRDPHHGGGRKRGKDSYSAYIRDFFPGSGRRDGFLSRTGRRVSAD